MNLTGRRVERFHRSLELALNQEWPQLNKMQRQLARLRPTVIQPLTGLSSSVPIVATVATDGGENRLHLEPIRVQVLRVADSDGEIYFEDFIPLSLSPEEILRFYFKAEPRLQKFLDYLGCDWDALLPQSEFQRSNLLAMLRELMEWAALLKLASQPPAKLLIRDGLLRSVLLTHEVFQCLRARFETMTAKHGHLLGGVAKRSRVINYLSVALNLNESFADREPSYVLVPAELEIEAAPDQYRWIGDRAMGQLYMARLDVGEGVPLMPVDIAAWQTGRASEVMALLHESSRASFPVRGYPQALVRAHEHAHLGSLETEMLEQLLLEEIAARDPAAANQARLLRLLGRQLVEDLDHDQSTAT
jgi:hypothetical protein